MDIVGNVPQAEDNKVGLASPRYKTLLVGLLGVNMVIVFFDRNAFNLLAPMIQPEFGLTNTQVGMITGVLAATWGLSSFGLRETAPKLAGH